MRHGLKGSFLLTLVIAASLSFEAKTHAGISGAILDEEERLVGESQLLRDASFSPSGSSMGRRYVCAPVEGAPVNRLDPRARWRSAPPQSIEISLGSNGSSGRIESMTDFDRPWGNSPRPFKKNLGNNTQPRELSPSGANSRLEEVPSRVTAAGTSIGAVVYDSSVGLSFRLLLPKQADGGEFQTSVTYGIGDRLVYEWQFSCAKAR